MLENIISVSIEEYKSIGTTLIKKLKNKNFIIKSCKINKITLGYYN